MRVDGVFIVYALVSFFVTVNNLASFQSDHLPVEAFNWLCWVPSWSKAAGQVMSSEEHSPDLTSGRSMLIEVHFSGKGFEWFSVKPPNQSGFQARQVASLSATKSVPPDTQSLWSSLTVGEGRKLAARNFRGFSR